MGNKSKFSIGGGTNKSSSIRSVNRKRTSSVQQQQEAGQPPARPSGEVATTSGATCHYSEENPAKITHSFWLEQHSWLHQSQSQSQSQEATCEIGESARRESQPQERRSNKLLARWTSGLVRTFGGGGHSHPAARSQQADVGAEAAVESQKRESRGLLQRAERFNGRLKGKSKSPSSAPKLDTRSSTGGAAGRWFTLKSPLSSSTSTLLPAAMPAVNLPPVESKQPLRQQQQARSEERQRLVAPADSFSDGRSRSSCSAHAAEQVACTATPTKKPHLSSGSTSNSPYRQIARLFAGKSPVVSRKKAPAASVDDPNVPPSDEPAAGKRSRLVQFATKSERHASTGGLLSNLFVSPLFRRRDCGSSCCSSSAASGEIRGDEPLSGGAKRKRKKRSRKDASVQGMASGERTKPDKKQQQQDRLVEAAVASPPDNGRSDGLEFQARRQQHYANEPEQVADERSPARDRPIEAQAATQTTVAAQSGGASAVLVAGRVSLMDQDGRAEDCDKMSLQQQLGGQKRPKVGHQHDSLVACEQDGTDPKQLAKQIDSASCSPVKPEAMVKREQGQQPLQEHASGQVEAETYIWPGARPSTEAERSLLPLIRPLASSHSSSFGSLLSMNLNSSSQQVGGQVGGSAEALRAADDEENEPPVAATDLGVTRELVDCEPPAARADNNDGLHVDLTDASERPASLPAAAAVVDVPGGGTSKQLMATMSIRQKQTPAPAQTTSGVGMLKSNFKKLVKRQQSVDSYRMARDLKNKLKRQHGADRNKHQSNEAIKTKSVGDDSTVGGASGRVSGSCNLMGHSSNATTKQQTAAKGSGAAEAASKLRICIDPYAKPGSFTLPGESAIASEKRDSDGGETEESPKSPRHASGKQQAAGGKQQSRGGAQPPNTLSLMPSQQFIVGSFSGCITPTYPTHHLPSPKYAPASTHKKYSNASSTLSSSLGADSSLHSGATRVQLQQQHQQLQANGTEAPSTHSPADTECSLIGQGQSPMNLSSLGGGGLQATATLAGGSDTPNSAMTPDTRSPQPAPAIQQADHHAVEQLAAEEAARRAQLAEHIYDNKCGLGEDMKFLASLPELCDITFLVGETREPVCAVKSVLAARSRVFNTILFGNRTRRGAYGRQQRESAGAGDWASGNNEMVADSKSNSRRDSSPKGGGGGTKRSALSLAKSSSPSAGRSTSPNAGAGGGSGQQQWSVTADASGYNPQTPSPQMGESAASHERGRFSVTSQGRDSSSGIHTGSMGGSQGGGSQQPLIIGPGQTATPAPASKRGGGKSKKGSIRDSSHHGGSRLTRMFTKRASDPSIKHSNNNHVANQSNYLDKMSSSQMSTTMIIEEFEPDVFRQLIEYIHTGCVLLQARTLLGLLNAADYYGLDQLRKACLRFVTYCITVDTVCSLLSTAERYIQYKCTKSIVQKVLEFVDTHADEIFKLNAFGLLPEHVVRLILARDGLQADEQVKYNGVYTWCEHYCRSYELTNIADVMSNFLDLIQFHKIPTNILLGEIYPTRIVPDNIFLSALAYQADPQSFEPQPSQARRMTLPNPTIHKTSSANEEADNDNDNDDSYESRPHDGHARAGRQSAASATTTITTTDDGASRSDSQLRLQPGAQSQDAKEPSVSAANKRMSSSAQSDGNAFGGSQQQLASSGKQRAAATGRAVRSRKSTGGQPEVVGQCAAASSQASGEQPLGGGRSTRLRKGSIAQMSINGMVRLSHKLSIKKRLSSQQPAPQSSAGASEPPASYRRRLASLAGGGDHYAKGSSSSRRKSKRISKQQSAVGSQHSGGSGAARDPLQLGQQILDAYLEEQRQRELREEARKRREQLESQMVEEAKRRAEQPAAGSAVTGAQTSADSSPTQHHHQHQARGSQGSQQSHKPIVKSLSTRKSFKDFKHISRRIFMRRSSSKMLQLQQQQQTPAVVASNQPQVSSAVAVASVVTNSQQ